MIALFSERVVSSCQLEHLLGSFSFIGMCSDRAKLQAKRMTFWVNRFFPIEEIDPLRERTQKLCDTLEWWSVRKNLHTCGSADSLDRCFGPWIGSSGHGASRWRKAQIPWPLFLSQNYLRLGHGTLFKMDNSITVQCLMNKDSCLMDHILFLAVSKDQFFQVSYFQGLCSI